MFVDEARIFVSGGRGGNGAVSFQREKYRPRGGPDGGSGGNGGSVVLAADESASTLGWLRDHPHQRATAGTPGRSNNRRGADGQDLVLAVPRGTVVRLDDGTLLADLALPGARVAAARGGRGGRGNAAFLSEQRRAPGFAELGEPGEEQWLRLELRLIADVAVIGYPNAGKSTLVGAVSAATPKVADYPFTTLEPTLGVVVRGEDRFTMCDIPGLIEGAHEGRGLGLKFLRHAKRALVFVHLLDLTSPRDPLHDYRSVRDELLKFDPALVGRPEVVALNKVDAVEADAAEAVASAFRSERIEPLLISAQQRIGLDELLDRVHEQVAAAREQGGEGEGFELFRTEPSRVDVVREEGAWRVSGRAVERWVMMTDLANPQAVAHLQSRLERVGLERMLADSGAREGDEVRIGSAVFEWWPHWKPQPGRSRQA